MTSFSPGVASTDRVICSGIFMCFLLLAKKNVSTDSMHFRREFQQSVDRPHLRWSTASTEATRLSYARRICHRHAVVPMLRRSYYKLKWKCQQRPTWYMIRAHFSFLCCHFNKCLLLLTEFHYCLLFPIAAHRIREHNFHKIPKINQISVQSSSRAMRWV